MLRHSISLEQVRLFQQCLFAYTLNSLVSRYNWLSYKLVLSCHFYGIHNKDFYVFYLFWSDKRCYLRNCQIKEAAKFGHFPFPHGITAGLQTHICIVVKLFGNSNKLELLSFKCLFKTYEQSFHFSF